MDVDDNFYDEIASFIPQPDDYTFNDLDEIIGSTVSQLDTSLGLGTFDGTDFQLPDPADSNGITDLPFQHNEYPNFNFTAFPSPATTLESATPPYEAHRTPSTSSVDGDYFNPDAFMSFLNDDDIKLEDLPSDTLMDDGSSSCMQQQRNTPSPTGSCSSSGGSSSSSTSGIQSDASSVSDTKQLYDQDVECGMASLERSFGMDKSLTPAQSPATTHMMTIDDSATKLTTTATGTTTTNLSMASPIVPISVPVLPIQAPQTPQTVGNPPVLQAIPQVAALNVVQGTILPIQTVPITPMRTAALTVPSGPVITIKKPAAIKVEPKLAPKSATPTLKILSSTPATATIADGAAQANGSGKLTPPSNAKPKTIFLSSNDFKALMQKMNTNGKAGIKNAGVGQQMPKIIMKAPNGKVITSNKFATAAVPPTNILQQNTTAATPNASKIIKTSSGPLLVKHQQQPQATKFITTTRAGAINTIKMNAISSQSSSNGHSNSHSSSHTPDLSIYKGILDEKMLKKQQRMIKNRESASLSRKKKKEYVVSLETRISNLEKENSTLKGENTSLRSQLMAFAQTCQCKNGNVSEFVLNSLNMKLNGEHQHVKIAPKPKNFKQRMTSANMKKNVAVLFAMAFMVTMNVGNFQNYLNKNTIESAIAEVPEETMTASAGRRLLWVETESEFKTKLNRTKREMEMDVPPLHFIKPVGRSNGTTTRGGGEQDQERYAQADEPPILSNCTQSSCGANQTEEYLRLASNLHKWIDGNDYLNLSMHNDKYDDGDSDNADMTTTRQLKSGFKLTKDYEFDMNSIRIPPNGKRKLYFNAAATEYERKQRKLEMATKLNRGNSNTDSADDSNSLELFKPKLNEEYIRLFKGIKRQDDTFYVLSFNMDHILLPASSYNKSARPKMSLLLPAGDPSLNGDIVLMQIDCEVINTTELALKSEMIPEKLRPNKFSSNFSATVTPRPNDVANNETGGAADGGSANAKNSEKMDLKVATVKEKPTVRTYMLVGPKTQAAAAAAKKQPTIVRISANDSRLLNLKNSTLLTKVTRDAVNFDDAAVLP